MQATRPSGVELPEFSGELGRGGAGRTWEAERLTLETPDMMIVLFFLGDLSFNFEDSLSCRMATSATGSAPFSTSSSAGGRAGSGTLAKPETSTGTSKTGQQIWSLRRGWQTFSAKGQRVTSLGFVGSWPVATTPLCLRSG